MELLRAARGVLALVALLLVGAAALWLAPPGFGLSSLPNIAWPLLGAASAPAAEELPAEVSTVASNEPAVQPDGSLTSGQGATAQTAGAAPADAGASAVPGTDPAAPPAPVPVPRNGLDLGVDTGVGTAAPAPVQLRAREASWIEVLDAKGEALLARTLAPGEAVGLDGVLPVRVKIGNAAATELLFRGQPVDLAPVTRDNVARLELK